ncbi:hypothetical protein EUGRSUZ_H01955 [Eucalyptus grandis]|uniref:Uncharacterized protein n=2 Tax=Eucalyptus grandis TaxID=71139 RepID=A0ACC3JRD7_EUCGR|nr:hypothetical protein EUGRSUZ_H01955 [Eucalyptus grandis]
MSILEYVPSCQRDHTINQGPICDLFPLKCEGHVPVGMRKPAEKVHSSVQLLRAIGTGGYKRNVSLTMAWR